MHETDHHLLVGKGAQDFARNMGFKIEDDLNTERSRQRWLEWKRRIDPDHYLDPDKRVQAGFDVVLRMAAEGLLDPESIWGTINCDGISPKGEICGVTTTSGLAFKIPGRAGDSPILGAGLYVDGDVGAAGSTGRGEANLYNLTSYLIVESMRRGMHPKDAGMEGLKRIKANTIEKRLLNSRGEPRFGINFYIMNAKGEHAGVTMYAERAKPVCRLHGEGTRDGAARAALDWSDDGLRDGHPHRVDDDHLRGEIRRAHDGLAALAEIPARARADQIGSRRGEKYRAVGALGPGPRARVGLTLIQTPIGVPIGEKHDIEECANEVLGWERQIEPHFVANDRTVRSAQRLFEGFHGRARFDAWTVAIGPSCNRTSAKRSPEITCCTSAPGPCFVPSATRKYGASRDGSRPVWQTAG